jgi:hypothetical protein
MANFFSNTWQILQNKATTLIQSPDSLKTESLILASLALVISRIGIAQLSAVKAHGTPEGPYRYRESIRTTIREVCGWTLGFMVLRAIQSKLRSKIGSHLGVKPAPDANSYSLFGELWKMLKNPSKKVDAFNMDLTQSLEPTYNKLAQKGYVKKFLDSNFAQKLIKSRFGGQEEKFVKFLYKVCPIALASIPTVALAGYALERFTRDHSDKVVDFVSGTLNKGAAKVQAGAGQVQAQMMQYSHALPFKGVAGHPFGISHPQQFAFQASPNMQATAPVTMQQTASVNAQPLPVQSGLTNSSPGMPQMTPPSVSQQTVAVAPQFAGQRRAIRSMPISGRPNLFAV